MKKLFLIFTFLIAFVISTLAVRAGENTLHTITLEKNNTGYNVIIGSDKVAKVVKKTPTENELVLVLSGISSSETVNALYKGTSNIDGLVIENLAQNKLRVLITADNIKNSTVIIEPIDGAPTIVAESLPYDKFLWIAFVLTLFAVIFRISKTIAEDDDKVLIKKDIKEREIQMYKKYRSELFTNPSIDSHSDVRMRKMLKKIDRKIDERLTTIIR